MEDRTGQQLGNYRLVKFLGQGGFAEAYLGKHLHLGTSAAVKLLRTQLVAEESQRFLKEASTLVTLEHEAIIKVKDCGIENNTPFLIMDYAPYGTLRQRHPRGSRVPLQVGDYLIV